MGHYLDMNVIGAGAAPDEPLQPGMVFAIEPLLFCNANQFAVFIEDNVLVTDTGYEVLSAGLPYTADEVETVDDKHHFYARKLKGKVRCDGVSS